MGFFGGGYDKPGRGVDPNAPKKRALFFYIELVSRKFTKFLQAGALFSIFSLPVLAMTYILTAVSFVAPIASIQSTAREIMLSNGVPEVDIPGQLGTITFSICSMGAVFFVSLWGSGPLSAALSYVFRCFTREEHVWLFSDGKDKAKENFKQGLIILLIDLVVYFAAPIAVTFYYNMSNAAGMGTVGTLIMYILILAAFIYTMMHPYMYQIMITFECKFKDLFKNSLLLSLAHLPVNVLLTAAALALIILPAALFGAVGAMAMSICALTFGYMFTRYPMEFYAARIIKKTFLNDNSMALKNTAQIEYEE